MQIDPIRTPIFKPGEALLAFLLRALPKIQDGSIVVVTSKIVALAQGRVARNGRGAKTRWIKRESEKWLPTKWCYLTLKDGHWCPNAGIDESNAAGQLILWPTDPYGVARDLRRRLQAAYRVKKLGVLITDSRIFPLRAGVTGVALGYAGFKGLRNYIGKKDIFGWKLKMTKTNVVDSLASAAVLVMGEGDERQPLAVVTEAPVEFTDRVDVKVLRIDPATDLYAPLFRTLRETVEIPPCVIPSEPRASRGIVDSSEIISSTTPRLPPATPRKRVLRGGRGRSG